MQNAAIDRFVIAPRVRVRAVAAAKMRFRIGAF